MGVNGRGKELNAEYFLHNSMNKWLHDAVMEAGRRWGQKLWVIRKYYNKITQNKWDLLTALN